MDTLSPPRLLFFKGGPGSGWRNPDHGGTHRAAPGTPPSSAEITTLEQAQAYWRANFGNEQPVPITVHFKGQPFAIHVTFSSNHAYTKDRDEWKQTRQGPRRELDLERATRMDDIWKVLDAPDVLTWSKTDPRNKQFDRALDIAHADYGRVVLAPTPTPDDLKRSQCTYFEFVSWHLPTPGQFREAKQSPWKTDPHKMRKARSSIDDQAFFAGSTAIDPILKSIEPDIDCTDFKSGIPIVWLPDHSVATCQKALYASIRSTGDSANFTPVRGEIEPLLKRMPTLPAGARWITVHPGGNKDGKGIPVLVQETQHGSGVFHVIGGAGGKLNYLKMRGLKSEAEYKKHAAERRKTKMEMERQRRDRDRAAGLDASKAREKDAVKERQHDDEKRFIADVAKVAGWTEKDTAFPHEQYAHLSPRAFQEMRDRHHLKWTPCPDNFLSNLR